jgi:predicted RNA binding protein YcfA (HicA-like mRNA interferase family)
MRLRKNLKSWNLRFEAGIRKRLGECFQGKGWALARVKGSHHIFTKDGRRERIVIPIHGNRPLKTGLLKAQMKIAELSEDEI